MDRTVASGYQTVGGKRVFADPNPGAGILLGTDISGADMTAHQESIVLTQEGAGITGDPANNTQLLQATRRIGAGNLTVISAAGTTVLTADNAGLVVCDATAGSIVLTLPACNAAGSQAIKFGVWRLDSSANTVTVNTGLVATGGATATMLPGGATSAVLSGASHIELTSDLAAWITSGVVSTGSANSGAYLYSGGTATVPASQAGWLLTTHGNEILTMYSPAAAAAVGKSTVVYNSDTAWPLQLLAPAGVFNGPFGTGTNSLMVPIGALAVVSADGANFVVELLSSAYATPVSVSSAIAAAVAALGFGSDGASYFKIPNPANPTKPWIVQFGTYTCATTDTQYNVSLPVTFQNFHAAAFASVNYAGNVSGCWTAYARPNGTSQVSLTSDVSTGSASGIVLTYICIGY